MNGQEASRELIWLNGRVLPLSEARVGVEDRGFQFADGVYEVVRIYNGRPFTLAQHLHRLERSSSGIKISLPMSKRELTRQIESLIVRSGLADAMVYIQVTRGEAGRNHQFPTCPPTLLFYVRSLPPATPADEAVSVKLKTVVDERWKRCWIKSIALLPNVLAKNEALSAGFDEAAFIDGENMLSECSASNLFAVVGRTLVTAAAGASVLPGITRQVLLEIASDAGIPVEEKPLSLGQAMESEEIFITSTTRELSWVSHWDTHRIARKCGPITRQLHEAYQARVLRETAKIRAAG